MRGTGLLSRYKEGLILTLVSSILLCYVFWPIISHPNGFLYGNEGDGLKNYFTPLWYILHDSGFHFSGMNYPYGEYVFFTDNQPIYSWILKFIHTYIISLDDHIIGLLNLWVITGIYLTIYFVFKILRFFKLPFLFALIVSIIIGFLNPQWQRIAAHYALSYGFYIPAFFYYTLKIIEGKRLVYNLVGFVLVLVVASLTHLYFLAILGSFGLLFFSFSVFFNADKRKNATIGMGTFMLTLVFLLLFIRGNDTILDRPIHPYGASTYVASLESVFSPPFGPINKMLALEKGTLEGISYVGLPAVFLIILLLVYLVSGRRKKIIISSLAKENRQILLLILSSIIILFFSFYWLHKVDYFDLFKRISLLNQFRSLGRFAWVFYYAFTIVMAMGIWYFYVDLKQRGYIKLSVFVISFLLVIWSMDAYNNVFFETRSIFHTNNRFDSKNKHFEKVLLSKGYKSSDFQAILSLPLQNIGNEIVGVNRGHWPMNMVYKCAYELDLPIMDINMSRTSISQSLDLIELLSPDPFPKERLTHLQAKPILLFWFDLNNTPNELRIKSKSDYIGEYKNYQLYKLTIDDFKNENIVETLLTKDTISDRLFVPSRDNANDEFYSFHFDDRKGVDGFQQGEGAIPGHDMRFCVGIKDTTQLYTISFWKKVDRQDKDIQQVFLHYYENDHLISRPFDYNKIENAHGNWVNIVFTVDPKVASDYCIITKLDCVLDEALVKPLGVDVLENRKGSKYINGVKLK